MLRINQDTVGTIKKAMFTSNAVKSLEKQKGKD